MPARPVSDWPEDPYPGSWPEHSYVVHDGEVHPVEAGAEGWVVTSGAVPVPLDAWLVEHGAPGLSGRAPVLSFGSNRCPSKVARQGGPMLNLRCTTSGLAAVWSDGTRRDGQVVATLVGREEHEDAYFLSLCTDDDVAVLDEVEGRGTGYDLVPVPDGSVLLEDGTRPTGVVAYVGLRPHRWPVAGDDGRPVLLTAMDQDAVTAHREAGALPWTGDDLHTDLLD